MPDLIFAPLSLADGQHVISRVETRLSDGSTRITNSLTPETAKLLAKLHPNMFPPETLMEVSHCFIVSSVGIICIYQCCFYKFHIQGKLSYYNYTLTLF